MHPYDSVNFGCFENILVQCPGVRYPQIVQWNSWKSLAVKINILWLLIPGYAHWNVQALGKLNGSNFLIKQLAARVLSQNHDPSRLLQANSQKITSAVQGEVSWERTIGRNQWVFLETPIFTGNSE
jgi:hypothetical protein